MLYTTLLGIAVVVGAISRSLDGPLNAVALFIAAAILVEFCGDRDVPRSWAKQNFHELVPGRQK